jgi:hypothetical protein
MFLSLNQLQNGVLTKTADQGMNEEMMIILTHTDATNTEYIIKDEEHIELKTSNGQQLDLQTDYFYLGTEAYHVAGTNERLVLTDQKIDLLSNDILLSTRDGSITIQNISTPSEDINSTISLNNTGLALSGNRIDLTTENGVYINGQELVMSDGKVEKDGTSLVVSGTLFNKLQCYVKSPDMTAYVNGKIEAIDLSDYAKTTEISDAVAEIRGEIPVVESEITEEESKEENAVNSKAVITYAASALTTDSTTTETMEYVDEKISELGNNYALKSEIPEVPVALSQIMPEDEIQPVSSVAVIDYVSAQIPPAPTLTFKTEIIEMIYRHVGFC